MASAYSNSNDITIDSVIDDIVFSDRPVEFKQTIIADLLNAYIVNEGVRIGMLIDYNMEQSIVHDYITKLFPDLIIRQDGVVTKHYSDEPMTSLLFLTPCYTHISNHDNNDWTYYVKYQVTIAGLHIVIWAEGIDETRLNVEHFNDRNNRLVTVLSNIKCSCGTLSPEIVYSYVGLSNVPNFTPDSTSNFSTALKQIAYHDVGYENQNIIALIGIYLVSKHLGPPVTYFSPPTWALRMIKHHFDHVPITYHDPDTNTYTFGVPTMWLTTIVPIQYAGYTMNINTYVNTPNTNIQHELNKICIYISG